LGLLPGGLLQQYLKLLVGCPLYVCQSSWQRAANIISHEWWKTSAILWHTISGFVNHFSLFVTFFRIHSQYILSTQHGIRGPNFLLSDIYPLPSIFIPLHLRGIENPFLEGIERNVTDPIQASAILALRVSGQYWKKLLKRMTASHVLFSTAITIG
jgi:hypothetical protein